MNRLFLLYYPARFLDKDELIGIYDDVIELKEAYDMVLADNDKYFEFLINNPYSELTVKEFDSVNQKFIDVDLEKLWEYADKLNHNYQAINLIISHEDMYSFYKNNVIHTKNGINICGDCPNGFDHKDIAGNDIAIKVYFSNQSTSEIMLDFGHWWGGWNECPSAEEMSGVIKEWEDKFGIILTEVAHDRLTFECKRKPNEAEAEQLLTELKELPSNALDIGDYSDLKNRIIEEGIFSLWWD